MELIGGYRIRYDAKPALDRLSSDRESALLELWENLYHQGDVGTASYAAVPTLVRHGELYLVAAIEVARHSGQNENIPDNLRQEYESALEEAVGKVPTDENHLLAFYTIHASLHGHRKLASALDHYSVDELIEGI